MKLLYFLQQAYGPKAGFSSSVEYFMQEKLIFFVLSTSLITKSLRRRYCMSHTTHPFPMKTTLSKHNCHLWLQQQRQGHSLSRQWFQVVMSIIVISNRLEYSMFFFSFFCKLRTFCTVTNMKTLNVKSTKALNYRKKNEAITRDGEREKESQLKTLCTVFIQFSVGWLFNVNLQSEWDDRRYTTFYFLSI